MYPLITLVLLALNSLSLLSFLNPLWNSSIFFIPFGSSLINLATVFLSKVLTYFNATSVLTSSIASTNFLEGDF